MSQSNNADALVASVLLASDSSSGDVDNGLTDSEVLIPFGSAGADSQVDVFDDTTLLGTAQMGLDSTGSVITDTFSDGANTFTTIDTAGSAASLLATALSSGTENSSALTSEATGNESLVSAPQTAGVASPGFVVTLDTPPAPIIDGDVVESTDQVALTGTAGAGDTVTLFDGQTALGTTLANSSGDWSFVTGALPNGDHTFYATATDAAGNTSPLSAGLDPSVGQPGITSLSGYGAIANGGETADNVLTLGGTAAPNTTVTVFDGSMSLGTATVNGNGTWQFTTGQLGEGSQSFTAIDKDVSGNISEASSPFNATVETLSGGAPASIGVNMEGAEFSWNSFPSLADLDYVKSEGVNLVRLPIAWEMMQPTLNGPLSSAYLAGLEGFLSNAASLGIQVIVDLHNAGTYNLNWAADAAANYGIMAPNEADASKIGTAAVPISAFANFWQQLATALNGNPAVAGYDIMNEPNNMPSPSTWPTAAQAAVNAIRTVDMNTPIMVEGDEWASSQYWQAYNANLHITDPANNIIYEGHQYFDNGSGTYTQNYTQSGDTSNTGVQEVSPFLQWLQANNDKGYIGELGVPSNDPQWIPLLNNVLNTLQADDVPATIWNFEMPDTSPAWWVSQIESSSPGNLNIAPISGQINPVMALIFEHSAPEITSFSPNSGIVGNGSVNAGVLTLTGIGAGDATVYLYDGTTLLGTTTSSVNGAWSFTTAALANGLHDFTAKDMDSSGDVSETSSALAVTVNATAAPVISSIVESPSSGDLNAGKTVTLTLSLSESVTINTTGGKPTLTLNDGATATYVSGSGNMLTFSYTAAAGQTTAGLAATTINLNGATIADGAGNAANLSLSGVTQSGPQIDTTAPVISSVVESPSSGDLNAGKTVSYTLTMSEVVTVNTTGGSPTLIFNDGGTATYVSSSGNTLTFSYTVVAGQTTAGLAATAINLNGATIADGAGNAANLSLSGVTQTGPQIDTTAPAISSVVESPSSGDLDAGKTVTLTLALSENVTVNTSGGKPTLALNDGATATYVSGSGNTLTFSYTAAAGQTTAGLAATAINLNGATIADGAGNAANLSLSGVTQTGPQIDTTAPVISSIVESPSSGDLNAGKTVTLTLSLSESVTINTTGGKPTLTLNDGATATYVSGSGNMLTFSYTAAAGQTTAGLAATTINLNGATIADGAGNAANLSLSGVTQSGPQIDTTAPVISSVVESPSSGDLNAGKTVSYTLTMSEVVTVNTTGGSPTLIFNDGGTATYVSSSGNTLTFSYTVLAGQNTPDLMVTAVSLNGATMQDGAGNAANLSLTGISQGSPQIDTTPPTLASVMATAGDYNAGNVLTLTLNMSEAVNVTGTPTLTLNDGGTATYLGGTGTNTLTFSYTVANGQNTGALQVTGVNGTISDLAGNALSTANLPETLAGVVIQTTMPSITAVGESPSTGDLNAGKTVTLTIALSENVTVNTAGGRPTLTLNDGATATYVSGSGNTLTFSYTVAAGQTTAGLAATAINLNGATIADGAGNAANLSLSGVTQTGPQIDTTAPTISSIVESPSSGDLDAGKTVTLTIALSENVTVNTSGGKPTLTLNDGATATYVSGSGNTLTFSYTVVAGQTTAGLAATAINLNGATIADGAGNAANLSLSGVTQTGPQIDTTAPVISSIVESPSSGDLDAGKTVTLTIALSENVTVNTIGGKPTLTLNDGATATYVSGSGNTLTFSYTVVAGQTTAGLAATAINLNGATIADGAGNAANLALSGVTQSGPQIDTTAPAAPVITNDIANRNRTVTLTGTAEAGSTVTVYDGRTDLGTTKASASGHWSYTTGTLGNGAQVFTATATDAAGNTSGVSNAIDPIIGQPSPEFTCLSPVADGITNVNTLTVTGTADANSMVNIYDGATLLGSIMANANGAWAYTTGVLSDGVHSLTATETDMTTGSTSAATDALSVTIDTTPPALAVNGIDSSANDTVSVSGTAEAYTWISINDGSSGAILGTATAAADGSWTVQNVAASETDVTVSAIDLAGNTTTLKMLNPGTSATIEAGATLELAGADIGSVTFNSSKGSLILDHSSTFSGQIYGFAGDGTLSGSDQIDLKDINYSSVQVSYSNGVLTVTDGVDTANLKFNGSYVIANFSLATDGTGGTIVYDPPISQFGAASGIGESGSPPVTEPPPVDPQNPAGFGVVPVTDTPSVGAANQNNAGGRGSPSISDPPPVDPGFAPPAADPATTSGDMLQNASFALSASDPAPTDGDMLQNASFAPPASDPATTSGDMLQSAGFAPPASDPAATGGNMLQNASFAPPASDPAATGGDMLQNASFAPPASDLAATGGDMLQNSSFSNPASVPGIAFGNYLSSLLASGITTPLTTTADNVIGPQSTLAHLPNGNAGGDTLSTTNSNNNGGIALLVNYMASSFAATTNSPAGAMVVANGSNFGNESMLAIPQHA